MNKAALGLVAIAALITTPALAADMAVKAPPLASAPAFSWTGFYIGADIGGAWGHQSAASDPISGVNQAPMSGTLNGSGAIGGVYAGYNFALAPSWLVGLEGDFSWSSVNASANAPNLLPSGFPVGEGGITWTRDLDWVASVRGRLGYNPVQNALVYVTGGGAWGRTSYSVVDAYTVCPNCNAAPPFGNTSSGFVVGAGVEWAFSQHWIARAEYLYYQLRGTTITTTAGFGGVVNFTWGDLSINVARAGLAYKF